jgi:transposase
LIFRVTRHQMLEVSCPCGHTTRALPWRAPADSLWDRVGLGEWRLVGPQLAGVIVFLALRMHLSRRRIRELLKELFGLLLSIGVIDETIREAGRASYPLEDALVSEVRQAAELFVDETSWRETRPIALALGAGHDPHRGVLHRLPHGGNSAKRPARRF